MREAARDLAEARRGDWAQGNSVIFLGGPLGRGLGVNVPDLGESVGLNLEDVLRAP